MRHATESDYSAVMSLFKDHRETFPHVRTDTIKRQVKNRQVIFMDDVVITYQIYKRSVRLGTVMARKWDCVLHQIVATTQGDGSAERVIRMFLDSVRTNVFLTVRSENRRAVRFYQKIGMERVGSISWAGNKIPGDVFVQRYSGR